MFNKLIRGLGKKKKKQVKVSVLGLDHAGKTTIIGWLNRRNFSNPTRTLGMEITNGKDLEGFSLKSLDLTVWDIGGQEQFRKTMWQEWVTGSNAIVYVIDANDKNRYEEAMGELYRAVSLSQENKIFLYILLNKMDILKDVLNPLDSDDNGKAEEELLVKEGNIHAIINKNLIEGYLDDFMWQMNLENLGHGFKKHVQMFQIYGTSAKTGLGLEEAFSDLFKKLLVIDQEAKETTEAIEYVPPIQSHVMGVHNVYVINDGGVTIVSAKLGSIDKDPSLVGGLLTALTIGTDDIFGSADEEITQFPLGKYSVYIRRFANLRIAVVADPKAQPRILEKVTLMAQRILDSLGISIPESGAMDFSEKWQVEFETRMQTILSF